MLSLRLSDIAVAVLSLWVFYTVVRKVSNRSAATPLRGPPRPSFIWGLQKQLLGNNGSGEVTKLYEQWTGEYGQVFSVPWSFGTSRIVIADPKAVAHFYARETYTYVQNPIGRNAVASLVCQLLICLSPA